MLSLSPGLDRSLLEVLGQSQVTLQLISQRTHTCYRTTPPKALQDELSRRTLLTLRYSVRVSQDRVDTTSFSEDARQWTRPDTKPPEDGSFLVGGYINTDEQSPEHPPGPT